MGLFLKTVNDRYCKCLIIINYFTLNIIGLNFYTHSVFFFSYLIDFFFQVNIAIYCPYKFLAILFFELQCCSEEFLVSVC